MGQTIDVARREDQGPLLDAVSLAVYCIALGFVVLRLYTRGCIVKKFGLDDMFLAVAVLLGVAQTVTVFKEVENGRGRHAKDLTVKNLNGMLKYKLINMLIYFVANWAVKMSIIALYRRLGSGTSAIPWTMKPRVVWTIAGMNTAFAIAVFSAQLFGCRPLRLAWDIQHMKGRCIRGDVFMQATGAINIATDVILLLMPLPLIPFLQINRRQRIALGAILSIGIIPVIMSSIRLYSIIMAELPAYSGKSWEGADSSRTLAWMPVLSQVEVDVGIIAASLPSLNPLILKTWSGFADRTTISTSSLPRWAGREPGQSSANTTFDKDIEAAGQVGGMMAFEEQKIEGNIGVAVTAGTPVSKRFSDFRRSGSLIQ